MKCKKGEVQDRQRTDREGGLCCKHALECLRHGADLSCQRQGSAPGPWKASCKGRFIFDRFAFEFLRFFAKGVVEQKWKFDAKAYGKNAFMRFSSELVQR